MNKLKEFFEDKAMMKAWAEYILVELNEEALRRVYKGKDTGAIKEAHDIIDKSFAKLAKQFTPEPTARTTRRAV